MRGNLMAISVESLNETVVSPFVRHIECAPQRTPIRVLTGRIKDGLKYFVQFVVYRVLKR